MRFLAAIYVRTAGLYFALHQLQKFTFQFQTLFALPYDTVSKLTSTYCLKLTIHQLNVGESKYVCFIQVALTSREMLKITRCNTVVHPD